MSEHEDAARREAIMGMFDPVRLGEEPPEPPIEGLAPADKPVADYTEEERAALHLSVDRTMREVAKREEREAERLRDEASRTPEERFGDHLPEVLQPGNKRTRDQALIRALHGGRG